MFISCQHLNLIFSFNNIRFSNNKIQYKNDSQKDFFTIYQTKTEELNEFAIRSAYPSIQLTSKPYKDKKEENINYNEKYQSFSQSQGEKGEKKYTGFTVKNNIGGVNILPQNNQMKKNFRKDGNYNNEDYNKSKNDDNDDNDDDVIIIIDSDSDVEIQDDNDNNNNSNNNNNNNNNNSYNDNNDNNNNNNNNYKDNKLNNFQSNLRKNNNNFSPIKKFSSFQNTSKNKTENANNNINENINENEYENENENNLFKSRIILIEDTPHLLQRLFNTDNTGVKRSSGSGDISDQNNR